MQRTETRTVEIKETIYYCDACNKRIGLKDDLAKCTQLFTHSGDRDLVMGGTYRHVDHFYLLCDECYRAFHEYLTIENSNKKGLAILLPKED